MTQLSNESGSQSLQFQAKRLLAWVNKYYFRLAFGIPFGIITLLCLGVTANGLGWSGVNFLLALLFIIGAAALAFHPVVQLIRAGGHVISDTFPSFAKYTRAVVHVLLFVGLVFTVLGTLKIQHLEAVFPVFIILLLVGFAFYLWPNKVWYKRIVWFILIKLFVLWTVWAYISADTISFFQDQYRTFSRTTIKARLAITSVAPTELTHWNDANSDGEIQLIEKKKVMAEAGCYMFRVSEAHTKLDFGGPRSPFHELGGIMLLNGYLHNEPFELKEGERIVVSFYSFGKDRYPKVVTATGYQVLHIKLDPVVCSDEE